MNRHSKKPHRLACALLVALLGLALATPVHAQPADYPVDKPVPSGIAYGEVITQFGKESSGWSFCVGGKTTTEVMQVLMAEARRQNMAALQTPRQIFILMVSRLPCPVSPYREGVRPATAEDLRGMWVTPDDSQALSQPPRVLAESKRPPLRCEALGFFDAGEARAIELRGSDPSMACTIGNAGAFDGARAGARTTSWRVDTPGRLIITRSDVAGHEELWETFVVEAPFSFRGYDMVKGDVMSYLRKSPGATPGVATHFRHLRKLPN